MNRQQQQEKFNKIYEALNAAQRKAVDTIDGPVMVIAGPGTGKTQILSARIGKILIETDVLPQNILCLTYTDAGTIAMRKRLQGFIGPDAYKVNIYTFHAFCNDIIQENLSLFEKTSLDPISDLERIELMKQLIDSFPKNHPLKRYRGDVYFEINNLLSLFSTMKREGWTPDFILQKINAYIKELPTRDEFVYKRKYKQFNAGDLKQEKIDDEVDKMEKLKAAINEFSSFQQMMRQRNRYDFDDMINWVIKAFEENKNLLARYQEQFLYILVDEYQDTSGTQNKLVQLLINFWDEPNIFVVGDDDQSIYRFQGANVENMLQFADHYKQQLLTVVLTDNYRSTQPILDVSKILIDKNEERLVKQIEGLSKHLQAANTKIIHLQNMPEVYECETMKQEMIFITTEVEKLLQQDVQPGEMAVIYKENKYGEELARYFKQNNIPYFSKRSINLFDLPLTQKLILVLQYLAAEHDVPYGGDEMLFEILHFDWWNIQPLDIAKLSIEVADRKFSANKTSLRALLNEKTNTPANDLFSAAVISQGLQHASVVLEKLIADVSNVTLQQLFGNIIREAGVLSRVMQSLDKYWQLKIINGLFDFIKEETARNTTLSLEQIVKMIGLMKDEGISLPLVEVNGNDKGINLITAHGSKGLEFEYVFFAGCNSQFWEKKRKPNGGYKFPDTVFASSKEGSDEEELRRLFYVAITRAEQHLIISYSRFKNDGKELEPSMFIAEIQDGYSLPVEKVIIGDEVLMQFALLDFAETAMPEINKAEEDFITPLLDKFVMNVTALNNYLRCPLNFYFNNLIKVPSGKSEAAEFGSSVHYALQKLFDKMKENKETFLPKESFIADFEWYMHRHRESFTKEQFERRMEYGHEVLSNYYDTYIHQFNKIVVVERSIKNVVIEDVPLKGKLDKLEFNGKEVNVVDYKTGDYDKAKKDKKQFDRPNEKQPNGGDYWRQAVFYKILVDNYEQKDWKVISTEFDFIEPDKKKEYKREKVIITPEDITTVKHQIKISWEKIQQHDFYTGCGKEECHWCNFVKTNNLAIDWYEEESDEE